MTRVRLRDLGITIGRYKTGTHNSITDIPGVMVGHVTLSDKKENGCTVQTGVSAILPHPDNVFREKVLGGAYVINGFGKTVGTIQLQELGLIESPILLTNTFSVPAVSEGTLRHLLHQNPQIGDTTGTVNVIVGECNDGYLNDIRGLHVKPHHARQAILSAKSGVIEEGCVGAGTGMSCLGFKGGVGTSSRVASFGTEQFTVGAFVVSNFGLKKIFVPQGVIGQVAPNRKKNARRIHYDHSGNKCPLNERQLSRLAKRASFGLSRTGSYAAHGSGDIVIAFSTAHRIPHESPPHPKDTLYIFERRRRYYFSIV